MKEIIFYYFTSLQTCTENVDAYRKLCIFFEITFICLYTFAFIFNKIIIYLLKSLYMLNIY